MSKNKKNDKNKKKDQKRYFVDFLMKTGFDPKPLKGGWVLHKCPSCKGSALLHCDVNEFCCLDCGQIKSFQYLAISIEKQTGEKYE